MATSSLKFDDNILKKKTCQWQQEFPIAKRHLLNIMRHFGIKDSKIDG